MPFENLLQADDWQALLLTLELASISTLLLLSLGTPLAWWLARTAWRGKFMIEAGVALPLVLPPTVLGFYLLLAFAPDSTLSTLLEQLGVASLAFSFSGLVVGSVLYSLPFVVQPLQAVFQGIGPAPLEAAATLRASPLDRFFSVALPLARPGLVYAAVLGFAHTLGEFGVVLMIGGSIPGETRVASIAIYDHVEALDYGNAHRLAAVMLIFSFVLLAAVFASQKRLGQRAK